MSEGFRVTRVAPNLPVADVAVAARFYAEALGFSSKGDLGWVGFLRAPGVSDARLQTVTADATAPVDSVVSIGVDDVDAAFRSVIAAGGEVVHPLTDEPWGVRRFFVRDPDGNVINVVAHRPGAGG